MPGESSEITIKPDVIPLEITEENRYWRFKDGKWRLTREGAKQTLPTHHETGHMQMDADGKLIVYHSGNSKYGKQATGIFERGAAHRAKSEYNIRLAAYELLRDRVLKAGFGALIFAEYLRSIPREQARSALQRVMEEEIEISDKMIDYVKDYLPACTMNRYINVGGQTVFLGDAEKAGMKGAVTVDDLLDHWLGREKESDYSEEIKNNGRKAIEKTLEAFEYGSPTDQTWEKANQKRVFNYRNQAVVQRRIRSGRYGGVTPSLIIRVHEIESTSEFPALKSPWKD